MRDRDYTVSSDFLKRVFGDTLHKVELRACPDVRGEGRVIPFFSRDPSDWEGFARTNDLPGISTYYGMCTRHGGGTAEHVMECPALWVDIDCAKQGIRGDDARNALASLPYPPSIVVNSGGGLHAYWVLEEAVRVPVGDPARETIARALKQLVRILAGDSTVAEIARVMRLPGTLNSKPATLALNDGQPALCEVETDDGRVYDFETLCEWLEEQRPLLQGKTATPRPVQEADPFVKYAREAGYEPSIDIDAELGAMTHGGTETTSIHQTQLRVSMSMIARGYDDEEIVDRILAATEAAAPGNEKWNWGSEEKTIRGMIVSGRSKAVAREDKPKSAPSAQSQVVGNTVVRVDFDKKPKPESKGRAGKDEISILGGSALDVWSKRYGPLIHANGTTYSYEQGVWSMWDDHHDQMLRIIMQEGCDSLSMAPKASLISGATLFFLNRPGLFDRGALFNEHGLIIAGDGCVDPLSFDVSPHNPDHRAMFKVGASLEGTRDCSTFLQFLTDAFADKPAADVPQIISTLQEWFGSCLITNKPRSMSKGMLVHGGSRTGKTQLSEILRALLGKGMTSATSVGDIGTDFGLQSFLGKRGWICDDAIGQGEALDAERYKKIVTGEEMGVRRKNKTDLQVRFGFPVMITANHLPRIKDQSDAVYNRSLILQMTKVRPESEAEPAGYNSIAEKIIAEELTGVLWWAIEGLKRLRARGVFAEPECMKKAIKELQKNNNSVRTWLEECAVEESTSKVANADLFASFAGWYYQENGEGRFPWSQNGFIRALKDLLPNLGYQKGAKTRNLTGIMLTEDGKEYWSVNASRDGINVPKGASIDVYSVNQDFSASHAERASAGKTVF